MKNNEKTQTTFASPEQISTNNSTGQQNLNGRGRILIFSTAYLPFIGGAELAIKEITDRLGDEFEFDLITAKMNKKLAFREKIGNVTVYRLGIGNPFIDKLILLAEGTFFVSHLKKRNNYSAYWIVMISYAGWAAILANIFLRDKKPIVLTLQEGDSEKHLKFKWLGLISFSWRFFLKRVSRVTAISNYLLERARKYGFKREAVLIPNGVDIEKFKVESLKLKVSEFRKELGFVESDTVLVTTSRLVEKNAVSDVIEALKFLPQNVKFLIVGSGPLEKNLKFKIKNLKLEDRVRMLGEIRHDEIPKYLHVSDIFIRPSLSEGMGSSFIEAMAAGLPVIATPVGGITDFLIDPSNTSGQEATGLFCKVNDPKSIADKVMRYVNNPELKNHIIKNAKKMAEKKYDWSLIGEMMRSKVFNTL